MKLWICAHPDEMNYFLLLGGRVFNWLERAILLLKNKFKRTMQSMHHWKELKLGLFNNAYVQIIFSSVVVYWFIVIAFRVMGKKELSQLSVVDLVFILLISNAVQNAMVGSNTTLAGGLVAAGSLFLMNSIFKGFLYRFPQFNKIVQGTALMLIYDGKLDIQNMEKAKISVDEIMEVLREHGVMKVEEVDLAVLEVDGNISVLSNEFKQKTVRKRKSKQSSSQKQES